jgi:hypothetical protein
LLLQAAVLVGAGLLVYVIWRASRPRRLFAVRLRDGEATATTGTVTPAFLQCVREVAAEHGVHKGHVLGITDGRRIRLEFSRQFPPKGRQQIRNWWGVSGWRAGKRPRSRS